MKTYTDKREVKIHEPGCIILEMAEKAGLELKPLVGGVRIVDTDVVVSNWWNGLYLCNSGNKPRERKAEGEILFMPSDKGQWRSCVEKPSKEKAKEQALGMVKMAQSEGYLTELKKKSK